MLLDEQRRAWKGGAHRDAGTQAVQAHLKSQPTIFLSNYHVWNNLTNPSFKNSELTC